MRIVRFTLASSEKETPRPNGIGVLALAMCLLAVIGSFVEAFRIARGSSGGMFGAERLGALLSSLFLLAAELFVVWNLWKGENWARRIVLVGAFLLAAREVSRTVDNGGGLVLVMSQPVLFLEFLMSLFLLYWLNSSVASAWFKNASSAGDLMADHLGGQLCTAVTKHGTGANEVWEIVFEHEAELTLNCPWRIVLDDNLAFASAGGFEEESLDDEEPQRILQNLRVKSVRVRGGTSDLFIAFEMGIELQTWKGDVTVQWRFADPALTVVADATGLNSHAVSTKMSTEDSAEND